MGKYFGTDGIRGNVGTKLTAELAFKVGEGTAKIFYEQQSGAPTVVVGKDPRISSDMLENAVTAGLLSGGCNVVLAGMLPTPAVAFLVKELGAIGGVMVSASHNVYTDNGIKIFNHEGYKLPDEYEEKIEEYLDHKEGHFENIKRPQYGRILYKGDVKSLYINCVVNTLQTKPAALKVAVDCANGAASGTAKQIFELAGVNATIINDKPNGVNINVDCGSTHIEHLAEYVVKNGFDVGLAFDGDSDRCIAVDEKGAEVDGDLILGILALRAKAKNTLTQNTVVGTVMSNLGFMESLKNAGVDMEITKVGDRFVLERMLEKGIMLGGEASGHVILLEHITTGDGQLSGLKLLEAVTEIGKPLSEIVADFCKTPSVLVNLRVPAERKEEIMTDLRLKNYISTAEENLPKPGRILVRASGTEALIRILVECPNQKMAEDVAEDIKKFIEENFK